jgi:hypothetical protein
MAARAWRRLDRYGPPRALRTPSSATGLPQAMLEPEARTGGS